LIFEPESVEDSLQKEVTEMPNFTVRRGILLMNALGWLVAGVILGVAVASWKSADAAQARTPVLRKFYLTQSTVQGANADIACAAGYHMASLWEIFDTSNLQYDTTLGVTAVDAGAGPPAVVTGWIRTGNAPSGTSAAPGEANCNAWSSSFSTDIGSFAGLPGTWHVAGTRIDPWVGDAVTCDVAKRVWCVQN